jgi:hypothetical protein
MMSAGAAGSKISVLRQQMKLYLQRSYGSEDVFSLWAKELLVAATVGLAAAGAGESPTIETLIWLLKDESRVRSSLASLVLKAGPHEQVRKSARGLCERGDLELTTIIAVARRSLELARTGRP